MSDAEWFIRTHVLPLTMGLALLIHNVKMCAFIIFVTREKYVDQDRPNVMILHVTQFLNVLVCVIFYDVFIQLLTPKITFLSFFGCLK